MNFRTFLKEEGFTRARDIKTGSIVHVNELPKETRNGKRCDCICVECRKSLEACQGEKTSWYFRHQSKTNCKGGPMTALHLLAQELLSGNKVIKLRDGDVSYQNGETEFKLSDSNFRFDIAGIKSDQTIFIIEIRVTHEVDEPKIRFLEDRKIHSIEIDLRRIDPDISKEALLNFLLNDVSNQRIIYSPSSDQDLEINDQSAENVITSRLRWFEWLLIGAVILWVAHQIRRWFQLRKR